MATPIQDKNKNSIIPIDFEINTSGHDTCAKYTVRLTPEDKISILDVIEVITKQKRKNCRVTWINYQKNNPEVASAISYWKFRGAGQRDTPVAGIRMILEIIMNLPGIIAREYRKKFSDILVRVFGGDETLFAEIEAYGSSSSGISQLFQRSVARHTCNEIRDQTWHERRKEGKMKHVEMARTVHNKNLEIEISRQNCLAIYGMTPKELGDKYELNPRKRKDQYPEQETALSTFFLSASKRARNLEEVKEISIKVSTLAKSFGFHENPRILAPMCQTIENNNNE